jgi:hypothetical protein
MSQWEEWRKVLDSEVKRWTAMSTDQLSLEHGGAGDPKNLLATLRQGRA